MVYKGRNRDTSISIGRASGKPSSDGSPTTKQFRLLIGGKCHAVF
jgi:hypothetical protein